MNTCIIIGNLTAKPELRTTTSGKDVASFTVAVNGYGDKVDYFRVSAFGKLAENCARYLDKGRKVSVSGSVSVNSYTSRDGTAKASLELLASSVEFLSSPAKDEPKASDPATWPESIPDDDLPF